VPRPAELRPTPFDVAYPADIDTEWIEVMGYAVPLWVSDPEDEYAAFRSRVGLLEYSMLYRWEITGAGAAAAADAVFSRNVASMQPGTIVYGVIVDDAGHMIDDPTVAYYNSEHVLIVGGNPEVGSVLSRHLPPTARLVERREDICVLSVQGPRSRELLQRVTEADLSGAAFPYYTFMTGIRIAGIDCQVNRIGFTAELGFEVVAPVTSAQQLISALLAAGADLGATICGAAALMMCRIESGMVMAGLEYDETSSPFECRLGWAVDFDKGPFQGRSALTGLKDSAADRVVTVRIDSSPDGLDGAVVRYNDEPVGRVTMAVPSPQLAGATIAMARLGREAAHVGTELAIDSPAGAVAATVLKTPIYDPERIRVRS